LLSSKLVTGIYLFYLLYFFLFGKQRLIGEKKTSIVTGTALLAGLAIVFITSNPVSNRFRDIFSGSVSVIQKKKYNPSDYFNGLQFRLLQWKLVPEILSENENWMTGTGDANAQKVLVAKYISKNMYQGMPGTGDTGYLSYNTHNQFLQSLLTTGLTGAFFFLLLIASLLYTVWHNNTLFRAALLTVLLFSLTEACFETQYGILIFIFFPLFFLKIEKKNYQLNKL
jgi:O-antigen ligase